MSDEVDVYTVAEIAKRIRRSRTFVYSLIDNGHLAANIHGETRRSFVIPKQSLVEYLNVKPIAAKSLPSKEVADIRIARFMRGAS
jgi:excisionase family DNA binding protein